MCLVSIRGQARKARIDTFELEELELTNLSSMRVSNRIIPPSDHLRPGSSRARVDDALATVPEAGAPLAQRRDHKVPVHQGDLNEAQKCP